MPKNKNTFQTGDLLQFTYDHCLEIYNVDGSHETAYKDEIFMILEYQKVGTRNYYKIIRQKTLHVSRWQLLTIKMTFKKV